MIDHLILKVSDYAQSKPFYVAALKPLGYAVVMEYGGGCGMGVEGKPDLWLFQDLQNTRPTHVALHAESRAAVNAFHEAALGAGARDNGRPGVRKDYHPTYYAAFVLDPDGHNVEAVCHAPSPQKARRAVKRSKPRAGKRARPAVRKGARRTGR